jgi:TRAP-type C4-dicarboxylate transport system substrate-binding protein
MKRSPVLLSVLVVTLLVISLVTSCASSSSPSPAPAPKEPVILRMVMEPPPEDPQIVEAEAMAKRFYERSGGEYQIKVYTGGTLLNTVEYLDGVRTGAVEMTGIGWGIYAGADPRLGAIEIPFLFNNVQAIAVAQEAYSELLNPVFEEKFNQTVLTSYTTGGFELISTRPVKTLEDWNGLMVGAINPAMADLIQVLGGSPIVVMWVDLYMSLEKGVIDAVLVPTAGALAARLSDVASEATIFYACSGVMGYTINLDVWEAIPEHTQDMLLEEAQQTGKTLNEMGVRRHDEDIAEFEALGMDVYILPKAERVRWVEKYQPFIDEKISGLGEFGQKIIQIADKANALNP